MPGMFEFLSLLSISYLLAGAVLAFLASILVRLSKTNASTRHNIWLLALLLLLLLPLQSFFAPTDAVDPLDTIVAPDALDTRAIPDPLQLSNPLNPLVEQTSNSTFISIAELELGADPESNQIAAKDPANHVLKGESIVEQIAQIADPWAVRFIEDIGSYIEQKKLLQQIGFVIFVVMIASMAIASRDAFVSILYLRKLLANSRPVANELQSQVSCLAQLINLPVVPVLKVSNQIKSPLVTGIVRPVILLPTSMARPGVSANMLRQVLLHEMAHVKRRDTLIVVIQTMASVLLYWHPVIHFINRRISFERELACDDWVINCLEQEDPDTCRSYANNLVQISRAMLNGTQHQFILGCVRSRFGLRNRIVALLNVHFDHSTSIRITPLLLTLCLMTASSGLLSPVWPGFPFAATAAESVAQTETQPDLPDSSSSQATVDSQALVDIGTRGALPSEKARAVHNASWYSKPLVRSQSNHSIPKNGSYLMVSSLIAPSRLPQAETWKPPVATQSEMAEATNILDLWIAEAAMGVSNTEQAEPKPISISINDSGELLVSAPSTIEEITVTAERSLYSLRAQIRSTERSLYSSYNRFNDNDELDVRCHRRELYEDVRRSHRCWPKFFENIVAADAQVVALSALQGPRIFSGGYFGANPATTPLSVLRSRHEEKFEQLRNNIMTVAMENPAVYQALYDIAHLKNAYTIKREECMQKPAVLFVLRQCS